MHGNSTAGDMLDKFRIEIPSWGFANTGTRFGKFVQPGAATNLEEKFADAAQVHALTGVTPKLALHGYPGVGSNRVSCGAEGIET